MAGDRKLKDIQNIKSSPTGGTAVGGWKSNLDDPGVGKCRRSENR